MYTVYIISNTVNENLYVGVTSKTIEERFKLHIMHSKSKCSNTQNRSDLLRDMLEFGYDKFKIEVYEENLEYDVAKNFEKQIQLNDVRFLEYAKKDASFSAYSGLDWEEITFEQFKQHVLKEIPKPEYDPKDVAFKITPVYDLEVIPTPDNLKMYEPNPITLDDIKSVYSKSEFKSENKIIGYKLIKPEYKEAVRAIINDAEFCEYTLSGKEWIIKENTIYRSASEVLKESGVLNLWFEKLYDESITLKSGVKLSEYDIAEVKEILKNK